MIIEATKFVKLAVVIQFKLIKAIQSKIMTKKQEFIQVELILKTTILIDLWLIILKLAFILQQYYLFRIIVLIRFDQLQLVNPQFIINHFKSAGFHLMLSFMFLLFKLYLYFLQTRIKLSIKHLN